MADEIDDYQRFLSGAMSPREEALFRQRTKAAGGRPEMLDALRAALSAQENARSDDDASWQDLLSRIARERRAAVASSDAPPPAVLPASVKRRRHHALAASRTPLFVAIAATIVVAISLSLLDVGKNTSKIARLQTIAAAPGQILRVRLPDGSVVVLNADSRLTYDSAQYGVRGRAAELVGEAQFEVVHDIAQPFRVVASGTITEDLGTRFVIRAYPEASVLVAVASGRVAVRALHSIRPTELGSGQVGVVDERQSKVVVAPADSGQYFGWTTGLLVFRDTPLRDIARQLARVYGVNVQIDDAALASVRLNFVAHDETPSQAIRVLASLADATVHLRGGTMVLVRQ